MDSIVLSGVHAWAHHGVLPHERMAGQSFIVDLRLDLELAAAAASDDLADTLDYAVAAQMVADVLASGPHDLIETVAGRILDECFQDRRVMAAEVTVHKPDAPMPVAVDEVAVTLRRRRDH